MLYINTKRTDPEFLVFLSSVKSGRDLSLAGVAAAALMLHAFVESINMKLDVCMQKTESEFLISLRYWVLTLPGTLFVSRCSEAAAAFTLHAIVGNYDIPGS